MYITFLINYRNGEQICRGKREVGTVTQEENTKHPCDRIFLKVIVEKGTHIHSKKCTQQRGTNKMGALKKWEL